MGATDTYKCQLCGETVLVIGQPSHMEAEHAEGTIERIAVVDFFDDRESMAIRHTGPNPDAIYADIAAVFEAEGFDTIILFTRDELGTTLWETDIDNLVRLDDLR